MIPFDCPNCGKHLKATPEMTGRKASCFGCNHVVVVPISSGRLNESGDKIRDEMIQDWLSDDGGAIDDLACPVESGKAYQSEDCGEQVNVPPVPLADEDIETNASELRPVLTYTICILAGLVVGMGAGLAIATFNTAQIRADYELVKHEIEELRPRMPILHAYIDTLKSQNDDLENEIKRGTFLQTSSHTSGRSATRPTPTAPSSYARSRTSTPIGEFSDAEREGIINQAVLISRMYDEDAKTVVKALVANKRGTPTRQLDPDVQAFLARMATR